MFESVPFDLDQASCSHVLCGLLGVQLHDLRFYILLPIQLPFMVCIDLSQSKHTAKESLQNDSKVVQVFN